MPGDRGGGRESKGSSLKLKNPGVEKKNKKVAKADTGLPTATAPPPPLGEGANLDCGVALISRQFDRDRDRVIQRSRDEGDVCAMLLWSSDWEKQEAVAKLCADRRGQVGPGHMAAQRIARRRAGCNGNRPAGWKFSCADHARATACGRLPGAPRRVRRVVRSVLPGIWAMWCIARRASHAV